MGIWVSWNNRYRMLDAGMSSSLFRTDIAKNTQDPGAVVKYDAEGSGA